MKKLLPLLLLLFASPACAQTFNSKITPDCEFGFQFTATGRQPAAVSNTLGVAGFDNRQIACSIWHMEYWVEGFATVSIELDEAPSSGGVPGSWVTWPSLASGVLPLTSTTSGIITAYKFFPFVSVNLNSVTGTGVVYGRVVGYRPEQSDANSNPTSGTNSPVNTPGVTDPCLNSSVLKTTTAINVTTATTTAIAAVSGTTAVYPCGGVITIDQSATTADTALFEFGTGAACAAPTKTLTGTLGGGVVPTTGNSAATVVVLPEMQGSASANGFCIVSAGTTVNIQGYFTYVQQ